MGRAFALCGFVINNLVLRIDMECQKNRIASLYNPHENKLNETVRGSIKKFRDKKKQPTLGITFKGCALLTYAVSHVPVLMR